MRTQPEEGAKEHVSISALNRHIHSLRKQIRLFEEQFEQQKNYKVGGLTQGAAAGSLKYLFRFGGKNAF